MMYETLAYKKRIIAAFFIYSFLLKYLVLNVYADNCIYTCVYIYTHLCVCVCVHIYF